MEQDPSKSTLHPTSISLIDAARLLTKVGGKPVSTGMLQADLAQGAPSNPDGTIHLVHYAAWLLQKMKRGH